ncbi:hypothetical protein DB30_06944 [Enhygromyxa salina]|uniref:Yip1 domain-containing protein n=1 Tax=Enhygromyxa salina TaxID=215803 RepID=A0A0C2D2J0_9BACT|nr:hypothetical protein [Enhygromyxa salina]KIG14342.1 hypothetical protein DB30_06944 [Enhygromyxa salina]
MTPHARARGSAIFANLPARVTLPLAALCVAWASVAIELPDLDTIRRWIVRIIELIVLGGIGLAVMVSLAFIGAWVLSHLRQPKAEDEPRITWMSHAALWSSFIPVGLTAVAAGGMFVPVLKPLMLKVFAYAVATAGVSWLICIAALIVGGGKPELSRVRRGLLLAGTPFYCLAVWLSRFL